MNNLELIKKLKQLDTCSEGINYIKKNNYTFEQAWNNCEKANWLLWIIFKTKFGTKKERINILCDCAELLLECTPKEKNKIQKVIEIVRNYAQNPTEKNKEIAWKTLAFETSEIYPAARIVWLALEMVIEFTADGMTGADTVANAMEMIAILKARKENIAKEEIHKKMCNMIRNKIKIIY